MGQSTIDKVMDAMALALNFQKADQVSAKLVLTALLHFAKETDAPKMGLVKGSPHERLWIPLMQQLRDRGVEIRFDAKVDTILHDSVSNRVTGIQLADGQILTADAYISAMPVHSLRKVMSDSMREHPVLDNLKHLRGIPVITVQLYYDRVVTNIDNLIFSAGTHISVYADLATVSPDYHKGTGSIIELVVAPAEKLFPMSDEEILALVVKEFTGLHPEAIQLAGACPVPRRRLISGFGQCKIDGLQQRALTAAVGAAQDIQPRRHVDVNLANWSYVFCHDFHWSPFGCGQPLATQFSKRF
jgi:uncharacterized protein with NAD-binding domain and iron-sulfur cluster